MSTHYAEKEREFIAGLAEDTGRDLAAWMAAIARSGRSERNDIIDWLRHQGFHFSWASWLERIHHNGGRLIYAHRADGTRTPVRLSSLEEASDEPPSRQRPSPMGTLAAPLNAPAGADVQKLLELAKGLRPLAEHVLREIGQAVPGTGLSVNGALVMLSAPIPFAALHAGARKIRLYANFGPAATNRSRPAEAANKCAPAFRDMLELDDVRSVDEDFRRLIRAAAAR